MLILLTVFSLQAGELSLSSDLRDTYLRGHPIVVSLTVRNTSAARQSFPDLQSRPHLVRFGLVNEAGREQERYSTPPEEDSDGRWVIPPGGHREVSVEIPSGGALPAGSYELTVRVTGEEEPITVASQTLRLVEPSLKAWSYTDDRLSAISEVMTPWVNQTSGDHELYIHSATPGHRGYDWWICSLPEERQPHLSSARPSQAWDRYVYWATARGISYVLLDGRRAEAPARTVEFPWPDWELLSRGVTDPTGGLHVPLWIPNPGHGGAVKVLSMDRRGQLTFRKVVSLDHKPEAHSTADGAGQLRLLLRHGELLDLYTLSTLPGVTLPAKGRRLTDRSGGAMFADKPRGDTPGGLAVLSWTDRTQPPLTHLEATWFSLQGGELGTLTTSYPSQEELEQVLPRDTLWLRTASQDRRWLRAESDLALKIKAEDQLIIEGEGLLLLHASRGIDVSRLKLE